MKELDELILNKLVRYFEEHTWAKVEDDIVIIGISDFAQDQLGEIIYVELPQPGDSFNVDTVFGFVESIKTASDLFMPVSGEVTTVNTALEENPEIVNSAPYDDGWMIKVKPLDIAEMDSLLNDTVYLHMLKEAK